MATTRTLYDIYQSRPDLQREFPNWMGEDRTFGSDVGGGLSANKQWDINTWWNRHGQQEYPDTQLAPQQLTTTETEAPRTLTESPLSQAPQKSSYQIFNSALMDMLKEYQSMGTAPLQQRQLDLSTQQAQKILAESPAGFSPSQQSAMRSGQAGAIQPSIAGAEARQQTFQEQMNSFGNILTATKQYAQSMEDAEIKHQQDTRDMIKYYIDTIGTSAFKGASDEELSQIEKDAKYPKGFMKRLLDKQTIEEQKAQQKETPKLDTSITEIGGRKVLINNQTGEIIQDYDTSISDEISKYTDQSGVQFKFSGGQVDTIAGFDNTIAIAKDMLALLEKGEVSTGPVANPLFQTQKLLGGGDPKALEFEANAERVKAEFMKAISGAAVSEAEARRLGKFLPDMGKQENVLISNLKTLIDGTERQKNLWLDTLGAKETGGTTDLWDFSSVGGDTNKAAIAGTAVGEKGGQCGRFVNKITNLGVGDSYASKMSKMDKSIKTPQAGMVFVMPYKNTGHTGIIMSIKDGIATVKDSNWNLDEKISVHTIPVSKMTGFSYINKLA